jgi:hypothetical protein
MTSIRLRLAGIDSMEHAECRMFMADRTDLEVWEVDRRARHNLDADAIAAVLAGIQCVLGVVAIWVSARSSSPPKPEPLSEVVLRRSVRELSSASGADLHEDEIDELVAAHEVTDEMRVRLRGYRIVVTREGDRWIVDGQPEGDETTSD